MSWSARRPRPPHPAADDRADVGATMNLDETLSRQVTSLPQGVAAVFTDGMDRPMRIAVPLGEDREDADSIFQARYHY